VKHPKPLLPYGFIDVVFAVYPTKCKLILISVRKFRWIGHTLRKENGELPKAALLWNPQGSKKRGIPKLAGEDRSPKKWVETGTNYGSWRLIDRSGKNS
jgi:hypothetical protein